MKRGLCWLAGALLLVSWWQAPIEASDGWKIPSFNPFSSKKKSDRVRSRVGDQSGWSLPKLSMPSWRLPKPSLPKWDLPKPRMPFASSRTSRKPSMLQKMNSSTKALFVKTADVLNPWDDRPTGRRSSRKKQPWYAFWSAEEEEPRIRTITDFMALPRPEF